MIVRTIGNEGKPSIAFKLNKNSMVEKDDWLQFFSTKKALRRGLRIGKTVYGIINTKAGEKATQKELDAMSYSVEFTSAGKGLEIGCMNFDAENAGKIRKWLRS